MIKASSYLGVIRGNYDYLFFVVTDQYWLKYAGANAFNSVLPTFARGLGTHGAVVCSFSDDVDQNYKQILAKPWPPKIQKKLDDLKNPMLLVIVTDFETFDPNRDRYMLINFTNFVGEDSWRLLRILRSIEKVVRRGDDLFEWWEQQVAKKHSIVKRLLDAVELKPGIGGFSFDLKKFFKQA